MYIIVYYTYYVYIYILYDNIILPVSVGTGRELAGRCYLTKSSCFDVLSH